jgi:hypothetical protein
MIAANVYLFAVSVGLNTKAMGIVQRAVKAASNLRTASRRVGVRSANRKCCDIFFASAPIMA